MDRLRKLRGERSKLVKRAQDVVALADKEDSRPLSETESAEIDEITAKVNALDTDIKRLEALVEIERTAPARQLETPLDTPPGGSARPPLPEITGGHDRALDDPYRGFPKPEAGGLGQFLFSVIQAGRHNGYMDKRLASLRVTMGSGESTLRAAAGSDEQQGGSQQHGGFVVPVGFTARLLMLEMENDPTQGVTIVPMAVPTVQIPARTDKNHTSSVAGGITAAWRPETVALASSRVQMEQIMLTAHTLGGLAFVTEELLADSAISFAALLEASFRDAITDAVIRARISGTGVGQPMGVINSPALVSVDTTGQTTGTLTIANILGMRKRSWRYSTAVWLANHDTYEQLAQVAISATGSSVFVFSPARGIDVPETLLGRPIIFTEYASALDTIGDIMLCNWSEYLVGTRQGAQVAESMHVRFAENELALRFTIRQAGEPWWRSALTPVNGANTLSPFVALATRTT